MPRTLSPLAIGLAVALLSGCVGALPELDFDFRGNSIAGARVETAPRPDPDTNGLITYETYQVVVARRGDTVAQVASRVGLTSAELASFNGRAATDVLRDGEVLALPRRVSPGGSGTDIASIARGAIDEAGTGTPGAAAGVQPGAEPVRHRVGRGETAYSVARLYGVSVRSLAEWNGLGPDLAVRENQYLIIPIVLETSGAPGAQPPGTSVAPPPPIGRQPAARRDRNGRPCHRPPAAGPRRRRRRNLQPEPEPEPEPEATSRFQRPVEGPILRAFSSANEGIDISAAAGTPVRAAGDGEVAAITQDTDQVPILVIRHDGRPADGLCQYPQHYRFTRREHQPWAAGGRGGPGRSVLPAFRSAPRVRGCRPGSLLAMTGRGPRGHRAPLDRQPSAKTVFLER
jgi:lipoprotein NlpD